jgi:hypothetical protein
MSPVIFPMMPLPQPLLLPSCAISLRWTLLRSPSLSALLRTSSTSKRRNPTDVLALDNFRPTYQTTLEGLRIPDTSPDPKYSSHMFAGVSTFTRDLSSSFPVSIRVINVTDAYPGLISAPNFGANAEKGLILPNLERTMLKSRRRI